MMSPYSVSSEIRMASRTSASRMSRGRSSTTSCGTPRSAASRRAYATSGLSGTPTVTATQSGCMSRTCSRVSELSSPPESTTPTVRSVSTRIRIESLSAARTSRAASSGSSMTGRPSPRVSRSTYGLSRTCPSGSAQPWCPGGTSAIGAPCPTSALTSEATCRQPASAGPVQRLDPERVAGQVGPAGGPFDDGEGVLAAQPGHRRLAPLLERGEQHLGVALGAERCPRRVSSARSSRWLKISPL